MANSGWLIWQGHMVEWKHLILRSDKDFTPRPHFELTARNRKTGESVTFNDIRITDDKLKDVRDLTQLPAKEREAILNMACAALM